MEHKKEDMMYGLLTVKLMNPPGSHVAQYEEIKKALGVKDPQIDDDLGVVQNTVPHVGESLQPGERAFIVGVEFETLRKLEQSGHPNVIGCMHAMAYRGGNPPLHLKTIAATPPRKPKHGGPKP